MADGDESACRLSGRKRKRGLAVMEAPEYVGDTKTCPNPECGTELCVFKYLNNGKPDQPRDRCLKCKRMHTHYPPGKAPPRPHPRKKYEKHTLANPPDHCRLFDLRCPNPACEAENRQPRFLYYNNKNFSQPRYRCLVCNAPWQPKLKSKLPAHLDIEGVPTQADSDHNVDSCYTTESVAPIDMQEFVPPPETFYYDPEYSADLGFADPNCLGTMQEQQPPCDYMEYSADLGFGDPNCLGTMQVQQPPCDYQADQFVNVGSGTELYPNGDPNYLDVMQGSQSQQQYYPTDHPVKSTACANVNYTMQGQQPYYDSQYQCVDLGGADANANYMMQIQFPCLEASQEYYANSLECTNDPSMSYINLWQADGPHGQAGDQEQLNHPEECLACSDTLHVDAPAVEEQYGLYPQLDPALSSSIYAPKDTDQWVSEFLAVDGSV